MKRTLAVLAMALTVMAAGAAGTAEAPTQSHPSVGAAVGKMMARLPSVWAASARARTAARGIPDHGISVPSPDSALIYSWIEALCRAEHRRPGTPENHQAELWIRDQMEELGLEGVKMEPVEVTLWEASAWSLEVAGREVPSFYVVNAGFTGPEGVRAPLVWVGPGAADDFAGKDAAGKIVVGEVPFPRLPTGLLLEGLGGAYYVSDPDGSITLSTSQYLNFVRQNFMGNSTLESASPDDIYWNAVKAGAAAVCLILKDQPAGTDTHYGPYDGIMKPMPALWIGKREGAALMEAALAGEEAVVVLTGVQKPGAFHNVWGMLPGRSDEVVLITSHHDAPFQGAVEDGAGVAQVLGQAWSWSRVPAHERPRTLVFVVNGGHFYGSLGGHAFARAHRDIMERAQILITPEHLGGKEVEEDGDLYVETGKLALTVMFTTPDDKVLAQVVRALRKKPSPVTAVIAADFFGKAPTSDAAGYVIESGVPVVSWIGCPYYLLDAHDTLDKIDQDSLGPISETLAELVAGFMAAP